MALLRVLPASERPAQPWKNGQGVTWQVAAAPDGADVGDFDWRVSIAEISQDGGFSSFPGVDRTIAVIDGAGVDLTVDGIHHELLPHQPFAFTGEATTSCRLLSGTTRDLNLMTTRGRVGGSMEFISVDGELTQTAEELVLIVADGAASVNEQTELTRFDAVHARGPIALRGSGATVAVIRLTAFVARS
jgi:environmental stress-induced protein Ves